MLHCTYVCRMVSAMEAKSLLNSHTVRASCMFTGIRLPTTLSMVHPAVYAESPLQTLAHAPATACICQVTV